MSFTIAVGEDGYIKNKEIVGILTATFLLLMLFFTKEQPELVYVALSLFVILATIYLYRACVRVVIFTYQKACIIFLQAREQNSQVIDRQSSCVFEIATLKHIAPEILDDSMSVPESTMESDAVAESLPPIKSDMLNFIKPAPVHTIELEFEPLNFITVDALNAIEAKNLEVIEPEALLEIEQQMGSLSLVEPVTKPDVEPDIEPDVLIQCLSAEEELIVPSTQPDSLANELIEALPLVSLDETRKALRVEAYLEVEHAAAYLGLPVESFNEVAKNRSVLPVKKCGAYYLYKINNLDRCVEKLASKAWTQNINVASQEKIISEHGILTTPNAAQYVGRSPDILHVWREGLPKTVLADTQKRDVREGDVSSMALDNLNVTKVFKWIPPYAPVVRRIYGSVFYDIIDLDSWCDSPMASKRKPRTHKENIE